MSFLSSIWDFIWFFVTIFVFMAYLMALFSIISDLFRDRNLNGFLKAVWLLFIIFIPFLTALVYLIVRGSGMAERSAERGKAAEAAMTDYIRSAAGATPATELAQAKALLDQGALSEAEFETMKARILA